MMLHITTTYVINIHFAEIRFPGKFFHYKQPGAK